MLGPLLSYSGSAPIIRISLFSQKKFTSPAGFSLKYYIPTNTKIPGQRKNLGTSFAHHLCWIGRRTRRNGHYDRSCLEEDLAIRRLVLKWQWRQFSGLIEWWGFHKVYVSNVRGFWYETQFVVERRGFENALSFCSMLSIRIRWSRRKIAHTSEYHVH